jgi:hypothetical protein
VLRARRAPKGRRKGDIEVYSWGRYLTVTGWHVAGTPATIEDRQAELEAFEAETFAEPPQAPARPVMPSTNGHGPHLSDDEVIDKALSARNAGKFARLWSGDTSEYGGDDSRADLAMCCELAFWTPDEAQIDRLFRRSGLYREKWERADYRDATITKALATTTEHWTPPRERTHPMNGNGQQASGETAVTTKALPVIQLSTDMTGIVNDTQRAILTRPRGPHLFQRARQLCLIAHGVQPLKWLRRPADAPVIVSADPPYLRELATQAATWEKYDKRAKTWERTLPPPWVIETLVARPAWPFPPLEGIVYAPTLRPDGSLLDTPGYDRDTGLYLALNGTAYPPIRARPTLDEARTAIGRLRHVFIDFPFAETHHSSATLAAVLSLVARHAIQGNVPLFAVRSTTRSAGKGLLIDAVSVTATGRHAPRWAQADDDEEERKRLLTIALAGDPLVHIDNVTRALGSGPLDLALTAPTFADRILGKQVSREAPMHVVFFASGNNMVFQGDMARRVVPIDLYPQMERPEERDNFTHSPLLPWVLRERPMLVVAALTTLRAYFVAGCPSQGVSALGSFEEWSTLVRQALIWAGESDPCLGRQDIEVESDAHYEALSTILAAWYACYDTQAKTLRQVAQDIQRHSQAAWLANPWEELRDALGSLDPHDPGKGLNTRVIGEALRGWKGRLIGDKRFVRAGMDRNKSVQWRVEVVPG